MPLWEDELWDKILLRGSERHQSHRVQWYGFRRRLQWTQVEFRVRFTPCWFRCELVQKESGHHRSFYSRGRKNLYLSCYSRVDLDRLPAQWRGFLWLCFFWGFVYPAWRCSLFAKMNENRCAGKLDARKAQPSGKAVCTISSHARMGIRLIWVRWTHYRA